MDECRLSLCDGHGTPIKIDVKVLDVGTVHFPVKIMRVMRLTQLTPSQEMTLSRFVRPNHVLDVLGIRPVFGTVRRLLRALVMQETGRQERLKRQ